MDHNYRFVHLNFKQLVVVMADAQKSQATFHGPKFWKAVSKDFWTIITFMILPSKQFCSPIEDVFHSMETGLLGELRYFRFRGHFYQMPITNVFLTPNYT